ncbi:hypothetical protein V6N13_134607 [Hibiscus sabdariffa]
MSFYDHFQQVPEKSEEFNGEDEDFLELTLCNGSMKNAASSSNELLVPLPPVLPLSSQTPPQQPPSVGDIVSPGLFLSRQPPLSPSFALSLSNNGPFGSHSQSSSSAAVPISSNGATRVVRPRRNPTRGPREGKSETVDPPFPWATAYRATVHTISHLLSNHIPTITGDVQCKRCERKFEIAYDLEQKFSEIGAFIAQNRNSMHDRALEAWMNPVLPKCRFCNQENSAKPVISDKKKSINWLFLFLGQMIGCCKLKN